MFLCHAQAVETMSSSFGNFGFQPGSRIAFRRRPRVWAGRPDAAVFQPSGRLVALLARRDADPVLVRKANIVAATFHPELSEDRRVLGIFLAARVTESTR